MAGDDEITARAALCEMQLRIAEGAYSALGLEHHATPEDVRQSFLALTKQYHPARFGRMSSQLQRLSNEVFLGIKGAHDQLQKALGGSVRGGVPSQSGAIPVQSDGSERTPAPQLPRQPFGGQPQPGQRGPQFRTQLGTQAPSTNQQTQPLARGTDRPGTPPGTPPGAQRPNVTPATGTPRISSPAISRTATPITTPAPRVTPPAGMPAQRTTPALGIPIQQRPTSSPAATPPRPGTPQPAVRPGTPPPRASDDLNPGTIRYSGVQAAPAGQSAAQKAAAFDERSSLRECMMLLNERQWADARVALHNLASKVPRSKSYLALLCVARGREAHEAGRIADAQHEYQHALELEPELELAKQAIAELTRRR